MNLIHLLFSRGFGGLERYALNTARAMTGMGHRVTFLRRTGAPLAAALREAGLPGEEWNPVNYLDAPAMLRLRALVKRTGARVVHVHHSADLGLAAPALWRMAGVKLLFSDYMWSPRPKTDLYHRLEYGRVDHLIVAAEPLRQNAAANLPIPPERIMVIPYGLDTARFDPVRVPRGAFRAQWGIAQDRPLIGVISRLDPHKGQRAVIEAAPEILRAVPGAVIALVGDETPELAGAIRPELERMVRERGLEGSIMFTGGVADTAPVLADLDVYVLATDSETFSLGLLEAMAMGRACAGSDSGGTPHMLEHGGLGLLFEPKNPASLAGAVIRLLKDPALRAHLGVCARRRVEETYDQRRVFERINKLYGGDADEAV